MTGDDEDREDTTRFDALIERSSLGTQGARRLRERVPREEAESIRHFADLLEAMRKDGTDEEVAALVVRAANVGDTSAAVRLAELLADRGDLDEAVQILRALAEVGDTSATRQLAELLADRGDLDEAVQILRARADVGDGYAATALAELLADRGDLDEAVEIVSTGDAVIVRDGALSLRMDVPDRLKLLQKRGDLDEPDEAIGTAEAFHGAAAESEEIGYVGPTACSAAGITYRQLDYWARTGLVEPSVRAAHGAGSQQLYSSRDILVLKVVKRLLDTGISLQQIRAGVHLQARSIEDLVQVTLMSDGDNIYECTSPDEVVDLLAVPGVFGIALGRVWHEVEGELAELPAVRVEDGLIATRADELARVYWRGRLRRIS